MKYNRIGSLLGIERVDDSLTCKLVIVAVLIYAYVLGPLEETMDTKSQLCSGGTTLLISTRRNGFYHLIIPTAELKF